MGCKYCLKPEEDFENCSICKKVDKKKKQGYFFDSTELKYVKTEELPSFSGRKIIVSDLHETLDLLSYEEGNSIIGKLKEKGYIFVCLSWLGVRTTKRLLAQEQITSFDCDYRYLCFRRGEDHEKVGSKGNFVFEMSKGNEVFFLDDGEDHCVACGKVEGCKVFQITGKEHLIDVLESL